MPFTTFKYLLSSFRSRDIQVFKIWKLVNRILIKYDEKRYLSQFESAMFDSLR